MSEETTLENFDSLNLPEKLMQALKRMNFDKPMPIQAKAIPLALAGKDIVGSAQTGTGKTGAFGIPIVAKLMEDPEAAALIMTPTRELATQVAEAIQQMIPVPDIKTAVLIGGDPMQKQNRQLQRNPRLIVGTPGRINDHLRRGSLKLKNVKILVLDETDRMLDMGFGIQIDDIIEHMPQKRQTLLFSATLPNKIVAVAKKYTTDAQRIAVGSTHSPAKNVKQEVVHTSDKDKFTQLMAQLEAREGSVIIFVKTKFGTERLAKRLSNQDYESDAIHGDLKQRRRDRVIQKFRDKKYRILVATDIAARGLDIPHIEHVINYDLPQCPEDYIHRIGRTARAGAEGAAVNLITKADGMKWRAIERLLGGNDNAAPSDFSEGRKRKGKPRRSGYKKSSDSAFGGGKFKKSYSGNKTTGSDDKPSYKGKRSEESKSHAKPFYKRERTDEGNSSEKTFYKGRHAEEGKSNDKPFYKGRRSEEGKSNDKPFYKGKRSEGGKSNDKPFYKAKRTEEGKSNDKPFYKGKRVEAGKSNDKPFYKAKRAEGGKTEGGKSDGGKKRFSKKPAGNGGPARKGPARGGNNTGGGSQHRRRKAA